MKTVITLIIFAAAIPFASLSSPALAQGSAGPLLWQDVRAGMSETELRTLHPTVQPVQQGVVVQNNVAVAGTTFEAYFQLVGGRVQHVQLQSETANTQNLIDALAAKYGAASSSYKCDSPNVAANRCTGVWTAPDGVAVTLTVFNALGSSTASIRYEAAASNGL